MKAEKTHHQQISKNIIPTRHLLTTFFALLLSCTFHYTAKAQEKLQQKIIKTIRNTEIARAKAFLFADPVTVVHSHCERSKGGKHDFYSEGDYWWPDPQNPDGPYIRRDGESNPHNFSAHRHAMVRFSEIVATLTSAWVLTHDTLYARHALKHLNAWFVDSTTLMNPNMLYAQAIFGRVSGRGIGLIDAYHLVEVAQSVKKLEATGGCTIDELIKIKQWFSEFLTWMTTHPYGIEEMNTKNNHAVCWLATASAMATVTDNQKLINFCKNRFKHIILPQQMAEDGSFPLELKRTKPFGYSLFNCDAFFTTAKILSSSEDNLFNFETNNHRSLRKAIRFIFPYVKNKNSWPFGKDIYIWDQWPARHSFLLFGGLAWNEKKYIEQWLKLPAYPTHPEVLRNLPVRHPVIWLNN